VSLSSSQPGGPPCYASPLAFDLIGYIFATINRLKCTMTLRNNFRLKFRLLRNGKVTLVNPYQSYLSKSLVPNVYSILPSYIESTYNPATLKTKGLSVCLSAYLSSIYLFLSLPLCLSACLHVCLCVQFISPFLTCLA
jgi:hypothetical protein